jgi:ketosteroid isomerase-like protein
VIGLTNARPHTSIGFAGTQTPATQNVEIVHRIIDSFNAREIDEALQCVADDFEMDWSSSIGPLKGVYRGRGGAGTIWTLLLDLLTMVRWDPVEVIDVDESRVLVVNRVQMRARGLYMDDIEVQLWTVRDGKAERVKVYRSQSEALEAAGLRE